MNPSAIGTVARCAGRKPAMTHTAVTSSPWITATVAPPRVRPIMICNRGTGATSVSFKKPNWRSHSNPSPEKIEENRTVMPITPGATNCK
jgi:hypothetical protein